MKRPAFAATLRFLAGAFRAVTVDSPEGGVGGGHAERVATAARE